MNWLMERIAAVFQPHKHTWRRARKGESPDLKYCRCGATAAVKRRKEKT